MTFQVKLISFFLLMAIAVPANSAGLQNHYLPGEQKSRQPDVPDSKTLHPIREIINLSGDWQAWLLNSADTTIVSVPGFYTFQGTVIFQRSFSLAENLKSRHLKLVAEGINYRSSIFINEKFLGTHFGGFTRFSYDIEPEFLRFGENNEIRVLVDNWLDPRLTIPAKHRPFAEKNYGGIHRDIYFRVMPKLMLEDFSFQLLPGADSTKYELSTRVVLRNLQKTTPTVPQLSPKNKKYKLLLKLWEVRPERNLAAQSSIELVLNSSILQTQHISLEINNPQLWSPESPFLYELEAILEQGKQQIDNLQQAVGLRTITIEGNQIFCNQKAYFFKGVEWHNDPTPVAVGQKSQYLEQVVNSIKNLGMNAVRVVGFSPDPYFIKLCNESGLFVFEELPVQFTPKERLAEPGWLELAELQFSEMIFRDRNQPAVIAWGVGAGLDPKQPEVDEYLTHIRSFINEQDERLVYAALSAFNLAPVKPPTDFSFVEIFDLARIDLNAILAAESHLVAQPLFYSIGYPFTLGEAPTVSSTQKSVRQSYFLGLAAQKIMAKSPASGIFINALADWHLTHPTSLFGKEPPLNVAPYGLISLNGEKRLAYHHLAALFSEDKTTPLTAIHIPKGTTDFFTITGICLLLFFVYFYKRDRRIRVDLIRSIQRPHGFISDIRENRKIPIFETIGIALFITTLLALISASLIFHFKDNFFFDQGLSLILLKPALKARMIQLMWQPELLLVSLFIAYNLVLFGFAILIKFFAKLFGKKISLHKATTYIFWTHSVVLFLLPAAPVLFNLLSIKLAKPFIFGTLGLVLLSVFFRTIRGLAVLYFEKNGRVLLAIFLILTAAIGSAGLYYQKSNALFDYLALYLSHTF